MLLFVGVIDNVDENRPEKKKTGASSFVALERTVPEEDGWKKKGISWQGEIVGHSQREN